MNDAERRAASDRVSALVAGMADPVEVKEVSLLLQGMLVGTLLKVQAEGFPLKVSDVHQDVGEDGVYENHFTVVTESGIRIRVEVTPEET